MITPREMRRLELNASFYGLSEDTLMELAGKGLAYEILSRTSPKRVLLVGGTGNNSGDGLVALRYLAPYADVSAVIVGSPRNMSTLARKQAAILEKMGVEIVYDRRGNEAIRAARRLTERDVLLEGLFGTGLRGRLGEPYASIIKAMNASKAYKVAIDLPAGDDEIRFEPDLTVAFHDVKVASGELAIVDIGLRPFEKLSGPGDVYMAYVPRNPSGHKGQHGIVSVVAGGRRYVGAAILAALSAAILADLAFILTPTGDPKEFRKYPEIIADTLENGRDLLRKSAAIVVGPGLDEDSLPIVLEALNSEAPEKPKVVDATALRPEFVSELLGPKVLTPHAGEIKRLGFEATPEGASMAAARYKSVVLLKGRVDIVTDGTRLVRNPRGKPSMTVGGTGDVLAGLVAGFLSRGSEAFRAASAAAFINSYASERLPNEGLRPTRLIEEISRVLEELVSWSSS